MPVTEQSKFVKAVKCSMPVRFFILGLSFTDMLVTVEISSADKLLFVSLSKLSDT